jgi:serine/threonine protein kinase
MEGLLKALKKAHEYKTDGRDQPIIHRDISPHNILISSSGEIKLTDFGIAKAEGATGATRTGVIKGKLAYLSPEQANGEKVGTVTDLYCAGLVFYEILTGRRLFSGFDNKEMLIRVMRPNFKGIPWLLDDINQFLKSLLASEPSRRFATADAALNALESISAPRWNDSDTAILIEFLFNIKSVQNKTTAQLPLIFTPSAAEGAHNRSDIYSHPTRISHQDIPVTNGRSIKSVISGYSGKYFKAAISVIVLAAVLFFIFKTTEADDKNKKESSVTPVQINKRATENENLKNIHVADAEATSPVIKLTGKTDNLKTDNIKPVSDSAVDTSSDSYNKKVEITGEKNPKKLDIKIGAEKTAPKEPVKNIKPQNDNKQKTTFEKKENSKSDNNKNKSDNNKKDGDKKNKIKTVDSKKTADSKKDVNKKAAFHKTEGIVTVTCRPWANVIIDGKSFGTTPLRKLKLPIGKHRIILENKPLNYRKVKHITVSKKRKIKIFEAIKP